jgi:glutamyl-tRNA synthetase
VIARGNGDPLYPLVNPVDDAMMQITHVLRGEDLLPSTPRQIALYRALVELGVAKDVPSFGHLPLVVGEGSKKLSKRDPTSSLLLYRERGFLPEGLLNYLALLGWAIADDRDVFTMDEMAVAFDIGRVSPNAARFDLKKAEAINAAHVRLISAAEFAERVLPFLRADGLLGDTLDAYQQQVLAEIGPLVQERVVVLSDAVPMLRFLLVAEDQFAPEPDAAAKGLGDDAQPALAASVAVLEALEEWSAVAIEGALKEALVDGLGLKPRKAFTPLRVAITGRTVSPPLYESMEVLGRERSLGRLRAALV